MAALLLVAMARDDNGVSILVLLDWEWRRPYSSTHHVLGRCFNPCSVGLGMAAGGAGGLGDDLGGFNPCSSW